MDALVQWFPAKSFCVYLKRGSYFYYFHGTNTGIEGRTSGGFAGTSQCTDYAGNTNLHYRKYYCQSRFILLLIRKILDWMKLVKVFRPIALWLENKAMSKKDQIEKYGFWGLVLFVGIPLPWYGSLGQAL